MFRFHYNNPALKPRRQQLRRKSTNSEQVLWSLIRNRQLGYKFLRQYSVDGYVIDFYCPRLRLGIEIEGEIHRFSKKYDDYRNRYIEAAGIRSIHIPANMVIHHQGQAMQIIKSSLP